MKARLLFLFLLVLVAGACRPRASSEGDLQAVASFYPLYEFTKRVAGDRVKVQSLVPAGVEPHDYEPTPQDIVAIQRAKILIYNGAGFEPWVEKLSAELAAGAVRVEATSGLQLAEGASDHEEKESKDEAHHEALDPHVWLDPVLAQRQVDNILAGLIRADPAGRSSYEANAQRLKSELQALHVRFANTLRTCRRREFIATHAAFRYFARRYGLQMVSISGVTPEAEPSPAKLREIVREARRHGARVIYYETLVSPRVAETVAREVGARVQVLNPVEGLTVEEERAGKTYFGLMDDNLRNLVEGLECR